ncbi:MAG: glutamate synthase subunit beta [Rhodospirillales bacterium]|nr:glutamate synthase subunit beta [Rhodospirillales bacterium]
MGKPTGFMEFERQERTYAAASDRVQHYSDFVIPLDESTLARQGGRCMDCGIHFCHQGCPVANVIPDWNDLVWRKRWREASEALHATNNFPEFTGRICPAPCEASCTLNSDDAPVTIKTIECAIVDRAWAEGWLSPQIAPKRSGKRVAVVGSGPAGLAAAQQLARAGHAVTVFEKNAKPGGLLRYGIPDFKLEKRLIDRRLAQMRAEGVEFRAGVTVGRDVMGAELKIKFDAILLAGGAEQPRDLAVPGRELDGIHFAMSFLGQQNRRVGGEAVGQADILATDQRVVVIGGGDTGSDCIGTSIRQGARSVVQIEILPKPPEKENKALTWPRWPNRLRTSSSHEEGCERHWSVATKAFRGAGGRVAVVEAVKVDENLKEIPGSGFEIPADRVFLAMGFTGSAKAGLLEELGVAFDPRGNVAADYQGFATSAAKIFAAGDMRRGQSLVVWAIREGRRAARAIDQFLMGSSELPD